MCRRDVDGMPRACSSAEILQGDSEWSELEKVRDEKWKGGIDEYSRQSEEEENDHRTGRERYERWLGENFGSLASSSHPSRWVKTLSLFLYLFIHLSLLPLFSWYSKHAIKGSVDQGTRRIPRTGPNRFDISSIFSSGAVECRASCTRGRTRWTIRSSSFRSGIRTCPVDKPCSTCSDSPSCGRRQRSAISIWCTTCDPHVRLKRIPRERGREENGEWSYRWSFLPLQRLERSILTTDFGLTQFFLAPTSHDWPNGCGSCNNLPLRLVKSSFGRELKFPQRPHKCPRYEVGADTSRKLIPSQRTLIPICVLTIIPSTVRFTSSLLTTR